MAGASKYEMTTERKRKYILELYRGLGPVVKRLDALDPDRISHNDAAKIERLYTHLVQAGIMVKFNN